MKIKKGTIKIVLSMTEEMAKKKMGSLFIISKESISKYYDLLYPDLFSGKRINIKDESARVVLLKLAELDGGIIIDDKGYVKAYGAKIKKTKIFLGHGTRHSAALGISSVKNVISILSSEEDGMVRIFREGKLIAEINPKTGENQKLLDRLSDILTQPDIQIATSGGVASLLLGLNPLFAGAIFTGSWIVTKYGLASIKEFIKTGKIVIKEEKDKINAQKLKKKSHKSS